MSFVYSWIHWLMWAAFYVAFANIPNSLTNLAVVMPKKHGIFHREYTCSSHDVTIASFLCLFHSIHFTNDLNFCFSVVVFVFNCSTSNSLKLLNMCLLVSAQGLQLILSHSVVRPFLDCTQRSSWSSCVSPFAVKTEVIKEVWNIICSLHLTSFERV